MSHINLFQTNAEFTSAYTNDYIEPWVSYTMETSGIAYNKGVQPHDYSQDYLTIVVLEDGGTFSTANYDSIYISVDDGETWTQEPVQVNTGDRVLAKGDVKQFSDSTPWFQLLKGEEYDPYPVLFNVEGNVMSLYDSEGFRTRTTFDDETDVLRELFNTKLGLISAENLILPATSLTEICYLRMFAGCTSLTIAPKLPAVTLTKSCYDEMFMGCTSLTTAPELPATTLAENCYGWMFRDCSSLNYIKCLATNISAYRCTYGWVDGVSSTGTFVKAASMADWTTGSDGIPNGWTVQDA